ncbi:hypothetical protein [Chryseobacterium sp. IT-36CA2]|uniref:hypothetical protein n=1 Tax=Chryseobacterium sp. IT-36CA2 TaxID=3026460 RepID=UPI0039E1EBA4
MKNTFRYLFTFLLVSFQSLNAQSKVESFYNYDFQKISKEKFDSIADLRGYSYNQFETEDQIANILYQPTTKGKLNSEEYDSLKKMLSKIAPLKNEFIIIIYYPGKDKCNKQNARSGWNIFDRDFKEEVNRLSINNVFWIYKNNEDLKYYYPRTSKWQKDENAVIEKLFFKMHYPCFSSTTIDKNGNYISKLGEFGKQHVIQNIKELNNNIH